MTTTIYGLEGLKKSRSALLEVAVFSMFRRQGVGTVPLVCCSPLEGLSTVGVARRGRTGTRLARIAERNVAAPSVLGKDSRCIRVFLSGPTSAFQSMSTWCGSNLTLGPSLLSSRHRLALAIVHSLPHIVVRGPHSPSFTIDITILRPLRHPF